MLKDPLICNNVIISCVHFNPLILFLTPFGVFEIQQEIFYYNLCLHFLTKILTTTLNIDVIWFILRDRNGLIPTEIIIFYIFWFSPGTLLCKDYENNLDNCGYWVSNPSILGAKMNVCFLHQSYFLYLSLSLSLSLSASLCLSLYLF